MPYNVEDVFVTEGVPNFTFVRPPNYGDILIDIRKAGKPVVIEGQSGTGKTTTVRAIIKELGVDGNITYFSARQPQDVAAIQALVEQRTDGHFVIDDFHRLPESLREQLANIAKLAAEQSGAENLPKLILIGINQIGSDLIQLVDDIGKRTGIHRIRPGRKQEIDQLIGVGCEKLNIKFSNADALYEESRGDYWLTQQLCQSACTASGVTETIVGDPKIIDIDLVALRERVVDKLDAAYYPAVKEFCRGRRFRPSNDPYFKLLRAVGQQDSSNVDLNEMANALPSVKGSINNIKEHRLRVLIESKPQVGKYFYYNTDTKNFAIEDPALFYFIRHVDWVKLRKDCGFRERDNAREWDMAISFAGENRELARHITEQLDMLDVHVFFDELYEDNYLGRAWTEQFKKVFADESDLVVVLLDQHHSKKIWPTFERDCFVPRGEDGEVIPIFLDETVFIGIPRDTVGIHFTWDSTDPDWKKKADDQIVMRLIERVSQ